MPMHCMTYEHTCMHACDLAGLADANLHSGTASSVTTESGELSLQPLPLSPSQGYNRGDYSPGKYSFDSPRSPRHLAVRARGGFGVLHHRVREISALRGKSYMAAHRRHHAEVAKKATWPGKMNSYINSIHSIQVREPKRFFYICMISGAIFPC